MCSQLTPVPSLLPETPKPIAAPPAAGPAATSAERGSFRIRIEDEAGHEVTAKDSPEPDPADPRARVLAFIPDPQGPQPPPPEQLALQSHIDQMLRAARKLYPAGDARAEASFRPLFVALLGAARWGVEGEGVATQQAAEEAKEIEADMVADATGPVKNAHLLQLMKWASALSLPFLLLYAVLQLSHSGRLTTHLHQLGIERAWMASFMLLWVGCFFGVCISYALRSNTPTLADLIVPEKDFLQPGVRMLLAGSLSTVLVLAAVVKLLDLKVGEFSLATVASYPTMALLVGCLFGIAELALPGRVKSSAEKLVGDKKT